MTPTVEPVIAGSRGFALALLAPLTERIGTRPRVAADPTTARAFCSGPGGLVVVEFLGADTLRGIRDLLHDARGVRIVAAVPEKHAAAEAPLRALGVDVARWDGTVAAVVAAVGRQLEAGAPGAPRATGGATPAAPPPRAPPLAAGAPGPVLRPAAPATPLPAGAAPTPAPGAAAPCAPAPGRAPDGAAAAPAADASSARATPVPRSPAPAPRTPVPGAVARPPAPGPAPAPVRPTPAIARASASAPLRPPAPVARTASGRTASGTGAAARRTPVPAAPPPAWPAGVPARAEVVDVLARALDGSAPAAGSLLAEVSQVMATLSELEQAVLAGAALAVEPEPIRSAAVMKIRLAAALATVPAAGGEIDAAAASALLGELDGVLEELNALAAGAPSELRPELEAIRNALVREAIDFSEAVQGAIPAGDAGEAVAQRARPRSVHARLLSVDAPATTPGRRGAGAWVALAVALALAGAYHGWSRYERHAARAALTTGLPRGLTQIPGPPGGPRVIARASTTEPPSPADVARFKAREEARGNTVRESDGMLFIAPPAAGAPSPPGAPAAGMPAPAETPAPPGSTSAPPSLPAGPPART